MIKFPVISGAAIVTAFVSIFFIGLSIGRWKHYGVEDIRLANYCGIVRASREAAGLPKEMPHLEAQCFALEHAGWTKRDYDSARCFDEFNGRPNDDRGDSAMRVFEKCLSQVAR